MVGASEAEAEAKARRVCAAELNSSGIWLDLTTHTRKEHAMCARTWEAEFRAWGPKQDLPEPHDLLTHDGGVTQPIRSRDRSEQLSGFEDY